ncbi:MAG: amino acid ABC transporter permease [Planctomycetaceae bacterium]|nr:amino acid ABC transporter permease [Planctomycetaceae bacterium]
MVNWGLILSEIQNGNLIYGALYTLGITASSVTIGVILGLIIAMLRLSKSPWLRLPAMAYVEALRGTPMLVQILLFYFGIFPLLGFNRAPAVYAGIIAAGLNSGAYLGEIFRGGILSIDKGQREAALSLGLKNHQVMRFVILPQALANALPAIGNEFVTMIKDSSLVSVIAVSELTYRAMLVAARHYEYFTMYVGIALIYFLMTFTISRVLARLEKHLRRGHVA